MRPALRRRLLAALAALALVFVGTLVQVPLASVNGSSAQAVTARPMTLRYSGSVNGDILAIGNGTLRCDPSKPPSSNGQTCAQLHNNGGPGRNNNTFWMGNVDVDSSTATFNSSTATLQIPAGAQVARAELHWAGNTGVVTGYSTLRCENQAGSAPYQPNPGTPAGTQPRLTVGGAAAVSVPVGSYTTDDTSAIGNNQSQYYSARQDVTSAFAGVATGTDVPITVGNVWSPQGYGCFSGWSLTVVYDFGAYDPGNPLTAAKSYYMYDGHVRKATSDPLPETVSFTGFRAQGPGAKAAITLYEGDRGITADTAAYSTSSVPAFAQLPNAFGATNNIGVSVADGSVRFPNTEGTAVPFVNGSIDVLTRNLTNLTTGGTRADVRLDTDGDGFLLQTAALSVPTSAVRIDKTGPGGVDDQLLEPGQTPTFEITVSNAGSTALTNIRVSDPLAPNCNRVIPALTIAPAPGSSVTYTCTGPPVGTSGYTNVAIVRGAPPIGDDVGGEDPSPVRVASLDLTKTADPAVVPTGTDTTFTVTVTNTGDVELTDVVVDDPRLPECAGGPITLAPGASESFTCTATVTSAIENTATVTGAATEDPDITVEDEATARADSASVRLEKATDGQVVDVDGDGTHSAGDTLEYTFRVINGGSVPLTDVTVSDPKVGPVTCPGEIPVGGVIDCTPVTYAITQADVDAGQVVNEATVEADGGGVAVTAASTETTPLSSSTSIQLRKSAGPVTDADGNPVEPGEAEAGDLIAYTFEVENDGSTTLNDVVVEDPMLGGTIACEPGVVPPGATAQCGPVVYELTQGDIDAVVVENTATATGTGSTGQEVDDTDSVRVDLETEGGALSVVKSHGPIEDLDGNGFDAGDQVTYSFTVTNTANTTLTALALTDAMVGDVTCEDTTLDPGAETTCTAAPYTLTQEDLDAGEVTNTVAAVALDPQGAEVTDTSDQRLVVIGQPLIQLTKSAGEAPQPPVAGDVITYSFEVENTGAVTVENIVVSDPDLDIEVVCTIETLAPGESETCGPIEYPLTQGDIDAGRVINTATAEGEPSNGTPPTVDDSDTVVVPIVRESRVLTTKDAGQIQDANDSGAVDAGDTVDYTFTVQNTGGTTLTGVLVSDPLLSADPIACDPDTLLPGETATCGPATYTLTQDDLDADVVLNSATGSATDPDGETVEDDADHRLDLDAESVVGLEKTGVYVDVNDNGRIDLGDAADYTFTVTNDGARTLTGVVLDDPLLGGELACPALVEGLAPGETIECGPYRHALTQAEIDAGAVENTAEVTASDPAGDPVVDTAEATVPLDAEAGLGLAKTGTYVDVNDNGRVDVEDRIDYTFTVTNTGEVTLDLGEVQDPLLGEPVPCEPTALAPAGTATCGPASYPLTQADIDAGEVVNQASIEGSTIGGGTVGADATDTVGFEVESAITLTKTAGPIEDTNGNDVLGDAGDTIPYTFVVENTGETTVTDVAVNDPLLGADPLACDPTTLEPGASAECSGEYTLTVDDVTAGVVENTATASAVGSGGAPDPEDATDTVETPIPQVSGILLVKTASPVLDEDGNEVPDGEAAAGDRIVYTFAVENTGTTRLAGIEVTDGLLPDLDLTCVPDPLDPGDVAACTAAEGTNEYVLTQADVNAGIVVNAATASATVDAPGGVTVSDDAVAPRAFNGTAALALVKAVSQPEDTNGNGRIDAGDTVFYTFTVTNAGTETVEEITVEDPRLGPEPIACAPDSLDPDEQAQCGPVPSLLTQADIDAGQVSNTATASGVDPGGEPVVSEPDTAVLIFGDDLESSLELVKSAGAVVDANGSGRVDAGDTVDFTFTVTNTGAVTVGEVTVADALLEGSPFACDPGSIAPGEESVCGPIMYTLTQADVDAGEVVNTATASATSPGELPDPEPVQDTETVELEQAPGVALTKTAGAVVDANGSGRVDAGDTVEFTFDVENTGTTTLTEASITDVLQADGADPIGCALPEEGLAPGESVACDGTFVYTLTQADVDAGEVTNEATVTAADAAGAEVADEDSVLVPIDAAASLALDKVAGAIQDANDSGVIGDAGDTITYTFEVENSGAVTISEVAITDVLQAEGADPLPCVLPDGGLAPGESVACDVTFTYTLTQADVDAGVVVNEATADGEREDGGTVVPGEDSEVVLVPQVPQLTLVKAAGEIVDANGNGVTDAGDTVEYSISVENSGTVTVGDLVVSDPLISDGPLDCAPVTLAPGEVADCEPVTYTLTQGDIDAGQVVNTATVVGVGPGEVPVTDDGSNTLPIEAAPAVSLAKTVVGIEDVDGDGRISAGDVVTYAFEITNTGTTTLVEAAITDDKISAEPIACDLGEGLAPDDSLPCEQASYEITQADIDAGLIENTATVDAQDAAGDPATGQDSAEVPLPTQSAIVLDKAAGAIVDANGSGRVDAGDTVDFTFTVMNTGAVTVGEVTVADALLEGSPFACDPGSIAPGEESVCGPIMYTLTQADVDAGEVVNTATASATSPGELPDPEPVQDTETVEIEQVPGAGLVKSAGDVVDANGNGVVGDAGDTLTYAFVVTNTGTTTLVSAQITDALQADGADPIVCALPADGLAPDASVVCEQTFTYTLTQADVDAGEVVNEATLAAVDAAGAEVADEDSVVVELITEPGVDLVKTAGPIVDANDSGRTDAGDTVEYTFTVTNTGTTTLVSAQITDVLQAEGADPLPCVLPDGGLAPGESVECDVTFTYTLTQGDIDAGEVLNEATVDAVDAAEVPVADQDAVEVLVPQVPQLTLVKAAGEIVDANGNGVMDAGDTVEYSISVENSGTVTVGDLVVSDPLISDGPLDCAPVTLAPGEVADCEPVTYTLTQGDIDAGQVLNTATVVGVGPGDVPVTDDGSHLLPIEGGPAVSLAKSVVGIEDVDGDGSVGAGDVVTYGFEITNTGTTTLVEAAITDNKISADPIACDLGDGLVPGDSVACDQASYVITEADVAAELLENTATVEAVDAAGAGVQASDSAEVPLPPVPPVDPTPPPTPPVPPVDPTPPPTPPVPPVDPTPPTPPAAAVTLEKTSSGVIDANGSRQVDVGDVIEYGFTVTNTGGVPLTAVTIEDPLLGGTLTCAVGTLAPGAEATCGPYSYAITQGDIDAGQVLNTALVGATPVGEDTPVTDEDSVVTDTDGLPITGSDVLVPVLIGVLLLLLGGGLILATRRPRSPSPR